MSLLGLLRQRTLDEVATNRDFDDDDDTDDMLSMWTEEMKAARYDAQGLSTFTSAEQARCEAACGQHLLPPASLSAAVRSVVYNADGEPKFHRDAHIAYLRRSLESLPASWTTLDASRTWMIFWCLQGLDLLDAAHGPDMAPLHARIIDFMRRCAVPRGRGGGIAGGPGQGAHVAATYAAVAALLVIGTPEAYDAIDRTALLEFYTAMKDADSGAFHVQQDGECDVRGAYCMLAVSTLLDLLPHRPALTDRLDAFLARCQAFEGGFGGEPGNEAHGGYTYCALAAWRLLQQAKAASGSSGGSGSSAGGGGGASASPDLDWPALTRWLCRRQMAMEGGFQGRTHKLVDGCYSFWQAACFSLLPQPSSTSASTSTSAAASSSNGPTAAASSSSGSSSSGGASGVSSAAATAADSTAAEVAVEEDDVLFDRSALQRYVLLCCQDSGGGLRDKPGKGRDHYHSCYCLSGLSVAQHARDGGVWWPSLVGGSEALLHPTNPLFNLRPERVAAALAHFKGRPLSGEGAAVPMDTTAT